MRARRGVGVLTALALTVSGCTLVGGDDPPETSGGTSAPVSTPRETTVETFDPPREGRDWVVVVEDPADTRDVADALEADGLDLTSINTGIGMVTLRSADDDVAERATGVDGVSAAVTDRSTDWHPPHVPLPSDGDLTPATDIPAPPDATEGGDPFDGWLWGLEEIDAAGAHEVTTGRREVRVGVIDTGVDSSHPDLAPVLDTGLSRSFVSDLPEIDGSCEVDSCVDPVGVDDGGHGTHVAGTIAAAANDLGVTGVAPGITLVDLRAGQDSGTFFLGPTVNALTYAADQQLDVVNMSYYVDPWLVACPGGAKGDSPEQADFQDVALELMHRAYDLTHEAGVTIVTSAGNEGADVGALVARGGHDRHAGLVGEVVGAVHQLEGDVLEVGLFGAVPLRPAGAGDEPGVDVVAHVDDVELLVGGVGERIDRRPEEEGAGVLPGPQVDEGDARRHAGDAEVVGRGGDRAGDVRAVTAVVDADRVDAAVDLARAVDLRQVRDEGS